MKIIQKDKIKSILQELQKERKIIAPVRNLYGDVSFEEVKNIQDIELNYVKDWIPLKRFFFLPCEKLFSFSTKDGDISFSENIPDEKRIIFGLRSCDVVGINYLENFFRGYNFPDVYFLKRRENTVLISITCQDVDETCHCVCANSGPSLENGFDLQLTDLDDKYLVEIGSKIGEEFITPFIGHFSDANNSDIQDAKKRLEDTKYTQKFADKVGFLAKSIKKITKGDEKDTVWEKMEKGCLSCGGCIYACPTCSCFTVLDKEVSQGCGDRERFWDACVYAGYTREVSGHNPREKLSDRRKRWVYHKLNYWTMQQSQEKPGCVCCGRCVKVCLGINNSMPDAIYMVRKE